MCFERGRAQGLELLAGHEYIAVFDADFKPKPDFLVSASKSAVET